MNYHLKSFWTRSYWSYALLSVDSVKTWIAVVGGIWSLLNIFDNFGLVDQKNLSRVWIALLFCFGIIVVIFTRRPVKRISYKHPGKDLAVEVVIGDLFDVKGQKIISSNTTFDTDTSSGIISENSVQGQFTKLYYPGNLPKLDAELSRELSGIPFTILEKQAGKTQRYEFGTTVKIKIGNQNFYWFAMAELNYSNTAKTTMKVVSQSLEHLWEFISTKGDKDDIVIPVVGSGLGRLNISRKKMIATIAQSFIHTAEDEVFANKLIIVIHPGDVEKSRINLFEVKDLLNHYLP